MKGRVLSYSALENIGIISADDNARYPFAGSDWKDPDAPAPYKSAYVDFIIQDGAAAEIYQAIDEPTATTTPRKPKNKVVAGILALILGGLGIHKFYLGHTTEGIIHLLIFYIGLLPLFPVFMVLIVMGDIFPQAMLLFIIITLPLFGTLAISIIAIIEGIIYLTKSDEDFDQTYVIGQRQWF